MEQQFDPTLVRDGLVDAFEWGDDERLEELISQLAGQPRRASKVLDEMLSSPDARERSPAVFALGRLGGTRSLRRIEEQLAVEEAREDYDGSAVIEVITEALGHIKEAASRATLVRRFRRLLSGRPGETDVNDLCYALWRKRHPELISVVKSGLERFPAGSFPALDALLRLLETPIEALVAWSLDASVPLTPKRKVLTLLDEEFPRDFVPVLAALISAAEALKDAPVTQRRGEAASFCDRLFITTMLHRQWLLSALPVAAHQALRAVARRCVASLDPSCALQAALMLAYIGELKDMSLIEAHFPEDTSLVTTYQEAVQLLRSRFPSSPP